MLLIQLFCYSGAIACLLCAATWDSEQNPYREHPVEVAVLWVFALNPLYWAVIAYTAIALFTAAFMDESED